MKLFPFLVKKVKVFLDYSTIDGFGQIIRAVHWTESIFWLLALATTVYLTVRDCGSPISVYLREDSLSAIDFVRNDSVSFPGASICLAFDTSELSVQNGSRLEDRHSVVSFVKCVLQRSCFESAAFYENFTDHIVAAARLLGYYWALENGRDGQIEAKDRSAAELPRAFYRHLIAENVSSLQLTKAVAYSLCREMQIEASYVVKERSTSYDICSVAPLVWLGVPPKTVNEVDLLCYNIENFTKFESMEENYVISFKLLPTLQARQAYLSVDGMPVVTQLTSDFATIPSGYCTMVEIELLLRITLLSKKSRPCRSQESFLDCYGRCRVSELASTCNCSAVSWQLYFADATNEAEMRSCFSLRSPSEYEICASAARDSTTRKECNHRCLESCQANIFNVLHWLCKWEQSNMTRVSYSLHRFFYMHIREQLALDVSGLVSALGGIIGLWLGAGFIGLFEAVIFLPKALMEFMVSRYACGKTESTEQAGLSDEALLARVSKLELEFILLKSKRGSNGHLAHVEGEEAGTKHPSIRLDMQTSPQAHRVKFDVSNIVAF